MKISKPNLNSLKIINILSLDVAVGAYASGKMVAIWLNIEMPLVWQLGFPLAVWVIYTSDHLLDAWILKEKCLAPRHLFHYQYFSIILLFWLLATSVCMFLLPFWMPPIFVYFGLIMGGISSLHFLLVTFFYKQHTIFFLKEWGVGCIYFLGVVTPPFLLKFQLLQASFQNNFLTIQQIFLDFFGLEKILFLCVFFNLVMMNILLFAYFEAEQDAQEEQSSWTQVIGKQSTKNLIFGMGIVNFLILFCLSLCFLTFISTNIVLLLMNILLLIPLIFSSYWKQKERYRTLGDTIFLLPFLCTFFT